MAREVEKEYIETGKVKLVYVDFVVHEEALLAAEAAHCAGEQDAFWAYHDKLFEEQATTEFTAANLKRFAEGLKLDAARFSQCLDANRYRNLVIGTTQQAKEIGLSGTPTFIINQQLIPGLVNFEQMKEIIEEELAKVLAAGNGTSTPTTP